MPLIRDQLKTDPVVERLAAHSTSEFRRFAALEWFCAVIGAAGIAIVARGIPAWIAGFVSVVIAAVCTYRLRRERLQLRFTMQQRRGA